MKAAPPDGPDEAASHGPDLRGVANWPWLGRAITELGQGSMMPWYYPACGQLPLVAGLSLILLH
jgi:hypothetical protein